MSTRGLLSIRFLGQDYLTYNPSDSYPKHLGAGVVRFAHTHLQTSEAILAFGWKIAGLKWVHPFSKAWSPRIQGADLLEAVAKGEIAWACKDNSLFQTCLDCGTFSCS